MANGAFQTLRSIGAVANGAVPEAAPTATVTDFDTTGADPGRILRSVEVRVDALVTTNSPTHVTLRVYGLRTGDKRFVLGDIVVPITTNAVAEPVPSPIFRDVYVRAIDVKVHAWTAGSTPALSSGTVLYTEIDD
jgi:hypothetical protein